VYIFTEFQSDNELGRRVLAEYQAARQKGGSLLILVNLNCELEEHIRRMVHAERSQAAKDVHVDSVKRWRLDGRLAKCEGNSVRYEILDVGDLQPEQTAVQLLALLNQ
jgi:hypothetical protein